jgi:hypothetical protein
LRAQYQSYTQAHGQAIVDLVDGVFSFEVSGLSDKDAFDVWFVDNRPGPRHSVKPEPGDGLVKLGRLDHGQGMGRLEVRLDRQALKGFKLDLLVVARADKHPVSARMKRLRPRSRASASSPADGLRNEPGTRIDMNSNPKNPPEHSGDCAYYPIPSTGVGRLDRRGKTAVVVGAGPGGLTAALTIKEEGYENVIVFEKRSVFSRMNVVNLHPESLHIFERLNIVDRFLERASLIIDHRNHVFANGMELFNFRDQRSRSGRQS